MTDAPGREAFRRPNGDFPGASPYHSLDDRQLSGAKSPGAAIGGLMSLGVSLRLGLYMAIATIRITLETPLKILLPRLQPVRMQKSREQAQVAGLEQRRDRGEIKGDRLWWQQDPQAQILDPRGAGPELRHAGVHRRHPIEPNAPSRSRGGKSGDEVCAGAGKLGQLLRCRMTASVTLSCRASWEPLCA